MTTGISQFMRQLESIYITRRKLLTYSGAAGLASAASFSEFIFSRTGNSATLPNILLVTADDLGQTLGCYGDRYARTPNINNLARQGIRFLNAYVTNASCSSSRSSLFTGLYPHQTGYFLPKREPIGQVGLAYPNSGYAMDPRVVTMPQLLKAAGYRTGIIGKLHLYPEASFPFDYNIPAQGYDTSDQGINMRNVEVVAQRARTFFSQSQQPFFLKISYSDPHNPFPTQVNGYPKQPYGVAEIPPFPWQGIDTPAVRKRMAGYYNSVARLDAGIGLLLNQLAQSGKAQNTIVIFMGDHGPGFTRAKGSCYEAGLRVPLIVRWSSKIAPNLVNVNSLISNVDILPTVLQAAGLVVPRNLAGRSLIPLFQRNTTGWRSVLCAEYTSHTRPCFYPRRSIRGARYKYILNLLPNRHNPYMVVDQDVAFAEARNLPAGHPAKVAMDRCHKPPAEELYDLQTDPIEFNNLAGKPEHQARLQLLRDQLLNWRQQSADPLLDPAVLLAMTQAHFG
ncbi:hypothetical protein BWI75_14950 [Gloeocapsopsis sp. AAB1 = 1H9]|uniref:Sulfatase N-terminal domain-containing protein n=1 Tax=Gloeocapsopsis dulcis AAB1 = 1H9 TaxID=1433147 RepID=A0A6N8FWT3_9CHRO|nr:hypothetical protein [Gloeocapsopsis dulcis AAB1 = 1H9]